MPSLQYHLIKDTCGALFIGALLSMATYGITTLQAYFYYLTFPKDGIPIRTLVLLVWVIDTLHVIFMCHSIHSYAIIEYGNPTALADGNWSLFVASVGANVAMLGIVQCFFTYRIFLLCSPRRRWYVGGAIACLVLCHIIFGIITFVHLLTQRSFVLIQQLDGFVVPFAAFDVLSDISIAVALCILLWGNRSGFEDTNTAINRLIIFLINRCILTSAVAIIESVVFVAFPNTLYVFAIDFVVGKLYANSLLGVLNSRASLRPKAGEFRITDSVSTGFKISSRVANSNVRTRESAGAGSVMMDDLDPEKNTQGISLQPGLTMAEDRQ